MERYIVKEWDSVTLKIAAKTNVKFCKIKSMQHRIQ